MDNRTDMAQREAYLRHLIAQLPDDRGFSDRYLYDTYLNAGHFDLLDDEGKLRPVSKLKERLYAVAPGTLKPLPPEAASFMPDLPPVDVEAAQREINERQEDDNRLIYQAMLDRGDYAFIEPDGHFRSMIALRFYYDLDKILEEVRPVPVPASKEALMEKLKECPDEENRAIYYEMAREGKSFIDKNGAFIPPAQLGIGFIEIDRLRKGHKIHKDSDRITNGKDLYEMLSDRKQANVMDIPEVIDTLPEPVIKEFLNEVLARYPNEKKLFHVMQEMVDLSGKPEVYPRGSPWNDDFFFGSSLRDSRGENETTREKGLSYLANIVGKAHDQRTGERVELPVTEGVRCVLLRLHEPFQLTRPSDPKLTVKGPKSLDEQLARSLNETEQGTADAIKEALFGPSWRDKYTKSQGGNLPDPSGDGDDRLR